MKENCNFHGSLRSWRDCLCSFSLIYVHLNLCRRQQRLGRSRDYAAPCHGFAAQFGSFAAVSHSREQAKTASYAGYFHGGGGCKP